MMIFYYTIAAEAAAAATGPAGAATIAVSPYEDKSPLRFVDSTLSEEIPRDMTIPPVNLGFCLSQTL